MDKHRSIPVRQIAWFTLLLIGLCLARVARAEDFVAQTYTSAAGTTLPYRLLVPKDYDGTKKYPLVLFFHGAGERGTNNTAQAAVEAAGRGGAILPGRRQQHA